MEDMMSILCWKLQISIQNTEKGYLNLMAQDYGTLYP